jgi:signal transduction histidine kinase/DNA-binding response OmpR family regulator
MLKYNLILFYWLIGNSTLAQSKYIDSLRTQLEFHKGEDTTRVNILNDLSYQYQHSDFHKSLNYAEQARRIAELLSFSKGIAVANYRKAHCYWALGDIELSIEKALLAIDIAEKEKFTDILSESLRILAMDYRDQQGIDKATSYINQAEKLSLKTKNWDLLSRVYNTAGLIEFDKKHFDSSLLLFNKALLITEKHSTYKFQKFQLCQILSNIGECNLENNPDIAFTYFNKALAIAKQANNRQAEAGILCDLGRTLTKKGRYADADKYLLAGLRLAQELGLKRVTRHAYLALVDLKVREGKSSESFAYMKSYYDVRDSILNASKTRQIVELETSHEAKKNEQTIKLLEQEKRIQTIWRNAMISGSLLLLLALMIIYRLEQVRNRKNSLLLVIQKRLNANLKETDQLKSRFFANISHEFRTPLSLILAPIEDKINSLTVSATEKEDLRLIKRNADRLLELVNQLLDLSKLEAGKMQLSVREANLSEFITVLVASFDSLAESKGVHFFKNVVAPTHTVLFDADKLEKIINNILFNSFKFTPAGGTVTLSMYTTPDGNSLKIKIADTGKGMSPEEQTHIFTPFYQSKNTVDDGQVGTGLGLSLVNELVKLHKGEVHLTSQLNQGTTIDITLPIQKGESETNTSTTLAINTKKIMAEIIEEQPEAIEEEHVDSILVIEDNTDLRNYIASSFKKQFTVFTGKDGEEGLSLAIEHIPNLIISDVMMPNMDGVELTEKIKSDERTSHIPVVLLTAKTDPSARMQGYKTGADDYLSKPFSTEELHVRVANLIEQRKKLMAKFKEHIEELPMLSKDPSLDERFILKAREVIEDAIGDTGFSVEKLAEEMCLSRAQLFRKFKALIDTSPSEFINDIRLRRAAELIRSKADTLAQISYSVGFNEQSYFAKRFRKKFGVSPSEYANLES